MPRTVIVYRLSVYFSLCLTVSSLYLPAMKSQHNPRRGRHLPESLTMELVSSKRSAVPDHQTSWQKRPSVYSVFSKTMTRHASNHKNDQAFVEKMFNIFDLNRDRVIERREFKAVLQLLKIVNHNF